MCVFVLVLCCCCLFLFFSGGVLLLWGVFFLGGGVGGGVQADARTWVFGLAWLLYVCFYRELDLLFIVSATFTSCVVPGAVQRVQHLHDDRKKST